ncbi:MAG TPA: cytochrome c biogenesis protein CcdA [Myxococcales bacterium]|nr:cytochrome c biogenesis protein CcdA [Myxococcales bacterium]
MKKWVLRLIFALAVGVALPLLPLLLTQGVGPGADLSGRLGLSAGVSAGTFAILFLGGVLTSLTPCVYPLIPITVGIFGARQAEHRTRSIALSATYVGGIGAMYSVLGLAAALSGKAFGSILSSPAVVVLLAIFLFALAASMFGAFEIALPSALQQRLTSVGGKGFAGAFGMGLVAGVIAAPCTGPVLAGVLAYVATQRNAVLGFWMLFTYALGMGLLFFVLGATSLRLPRSGAWMETVKSVFGVALIAAAVALVLPLLPRPGTLPVSVRTTAIAAGVLAFAGVLAGAFSLSFHGDAREKALKATALVLLLGGVGLRFGWAGAPRGEASAVQIPWVRDEKAAVQQSRATGKPLLIDFFAEWCAACKELDVHTWTDPVVAKEVSDRFVPLKIDGTEESERTEELYKKYNVPGLPTVLMVACRDDRPPECTVPGDGPTRVTGFLPAPEMLERLRRVQ